MIQALAEQAPSSGSWFEAKLTLDGLLTFFGGVLAFFAILYQVRHADEGLQWQLDSEKRARDEAEHVRRRAVATALLFELDNFYRAYIRGLANAIGPKPGEVNGVQYVGSPLLPPFRKSPSDPFPVYKANGGAVGELPTEVTELVVRAYSAAQWVLDRGADYQVAREHSISHNNEGPHLSFARKSLEEMVEVYHGAEVTLGDAMKELCKFTGMTFRVPEIAIAELQRKPGASSELGSDPTVATAPTAVRSK